jgi:hypothetical protein
MAEEKIMGLTPAEIEKIAAEIYSQVDDNHPIASNSYDGFLKAFEEGSKKILADKNFFRAFRIKEDA